MIKKGTLINFRDFSQDYDYISNVNLVDMEIEIALFTSDYKFAIDLPLGNTIAIISEIFCDNT